MTQQYKVIANSRDHGFNIGEIVTKAPADDELNVLGRALAKLMDLENDPEISQSAVYINAQGGKQMLSPLDVKAIDD